MYLIMWDNILVLGVYDYEIRLENHFVPFMINAVNCCHAMDLYCLFMFLDVMGTLGCLELGFLYQKCDFCTSGLMNARLSVHRSLKLTKRREESPVRLPVRSRVRLSSLNTTFLRNSLVVQKCRSRPISCKLLLNYEPLNSKCLKYISKQGFKQIKTW